ncbi:uroporphyrinogen-III C-methyltransferase [Fuerstiella marisgermanici]|nr:uroporphyrinogen-III C-methyltransferase [Fuerstiella marisgermanici]
MTTGMVYLVGAGPGDPGLLTLRGAEVLAKADLVLYDGLANSLLLRLTSGVCERTARTKVGSDKTVPQADINDRLIAEATAGKTVVRLKGGDPYIFGRGSEEAAALEAAGIPFEVVPGITAATAAGEYAGFSFTHRDIASAVAFVTGHEDPSRDASRLDYAALAAFPGTLVFYMGLGRIRNICEQLILEGKPPDTEAAVICKASLPNQKVVTSTLSDLPEAVEAAGLNPPSLIVVGECVSLRQGASWFEERPLFGQRIGITRPQHQCDIIANKITALSGQPVIMPLIEINPVDDAGLAVVDKTLQQLDQYQWLILTSVNGVAAFMQRLWGTGGDVRRLGHLKIAAIGSSTAKALEQHSLRADVVPDSFRAEALAAELAPLVEGQNVLWARANRGRDVLPNTLREAGANVTECVVYRNDDATEFSANVAELDWVGLSSPSIARQFAAMVKTHGLEPFHLNAKLATISPVTTAAAKEAGLIVDTEATTYTWDGIVEAIVDYVGEPRL